MPRSIYDLGDLMTQDPSPLPGATSSFSGHYRLHLLPGRFI
jgi:hypothetical protein